MALTAMLLRLLGYALGTAGTLMILAHKGGRIAYLMVILMLPTFLASQGIGIYLRLKRKKAPTFDRLARRPAPENPDKP